MDKERLITTTLNTVKNKKLEKTSIGEITKNLKMSAGNIYYHFSNKNEIYKATGEYSLNKIEKELCSTKLTGNKKDDLSRLTKRLIDFLEKRDEILFFLVSISGSSYLDKNLDILEALNVYRQVLLNNSSDKEEKKMILKLRIFVSSLLEILYINVFVEKRKTSAEEMEEIHRIFLYGDTSES